MKTKRRRNSPPRFGLLTKARRTLGFYAQLRSLLVFAKPMKAGALLFLIFGSAWASLGQGTVAFINIGNGFNAPVYQSDRVTPLAGQQFMAELLGGPSASSLSSIATTGFLTGAGYTGYFNGATAYINSVVGGATAWVEVRVWNTASGASFDQAQGSGLANSWWASPVFTVVTGNGPSGAGPTPPAPLSGLGNSPGYLNSVPEPSAAGLAVLGAVLVKLLNGLHNSTQRTSGTNVGLKFEHPSRSLIGALHRSPVEL